MKSILFPFLYKTDFKAGYAWSLELATRLKGQLSIFTTIPEGDRQYCSELYDSLFKARQFQIRNLGLTSPVTDRKSVTRHFLRGEFESNFLKFIESSRFDVFVLPTRIVSEKVLKRLILSDKQIIYLPNLAESNVTQPVATRELFFLDMLQRASCYNLPLSFYKSFADDKSLFNSLASFFKQQDFRSTSFTIG